MKSVAKEWSDVFSYCEETGTLLWKVNRPKRPIGSPAGNIKSDGRYITIHVTLNGVKKRHYAHRIIWEMIHGECPKDLCIDHIDGNGLNNKLSNLRLVTLSQNQRNSKRPKNNSSGIAGVTIHKYGYVVNNAGKYITFTKDFFEACCAKKSAESKLGFHENHGRSV